MDNKHESRPYYYAVKDGSGLFWMVPISHKVEKYADKIRRDETRHQKSVFCYIAKLKGKDSAFLTGNVIPVSAKYIKRPFSVITYRMFSRIKRIQRRFVTVSCAISRW